MAYHAAGFDSNVGIVVCTSERQEMVAVQNYTMRGGLASLALEGYCLTSACNSVPFSTLNRLSLSHNLVQKIFLWGDERYSLNRMSKI